MIPAYSCKLNTICCAKAVVRNTKESEVQTYSILSIPDRVFKLAANAIYPPPLFCPIVVVLQGHSPALVHKPPANKPMGVHEIAWPMSFEFNLIICLTV
jgi:hypothetical protein